MLNFLKEAYSLTSWICKSYFHFRAVNHNTCFESALAMYAACLVIEGIFIITHASSYALPSEYPSCDAMQHAMRASSHAAYMCVYYTSLNHCTIDSAGTNRCVMKKIPVCLELTLATKAVVNLL